MSIGVPRIESVGSDVELVATAEGHKLTIYLDRTATNEPVDDATIEVSGQGLPPIMARRQSVGTYDIVADWVDAPGTKALLFTVTAGDTTDLLNGTLTIPGPAKATKPTLLSLRELVGRPEILGLALGALLLGFVLAIAFRSRRRSSRGDTGGDAEPRPAMPVHGLRNAAEIILIAALVTTALPGVTAVAGPGHDHGDGGHGHDAGPAPASGNAPRKLADGKVFVPKPSQRLLQVRTEPATRQRVVRTRELMGTVISDPSAFGQVQAPMDGKIELADRGISFVGQKVRAGEVLALLSPTIPIADLGTLQQSRAEIEGKLKIAEQKLARLTRIANVVAQRDIDDTRAELEALREQKRVLAPKDVEKVRLVAPVSGVISLANVRAGQVVSARDTLFEIVDPARLWVEGIAGSAHDEGEIVGAEAVDGHGHTIALTFIGRSPTMRHHLRPSLFRIDTAHPELVIGAPVKVLARTPQSNEEIVVPEAAVVRGSNGLHYVWVKESPERFRAALVRTEPLDGGRAAVLAGLEPGERVVTTGAELINQIR